MSKDLSYQVKIDMTILACLTSHIYNIYVTFGRGGGVLHIIPNLSTYVAMCKLGGFDQKNGGFWIAIPD